MSRKQTRKGAARRFAVLFGFDTKDRGKTGYLRAGEAGCSVVEDRRDATEFPLSAEPGKGTPRDWCEFFKTEQGVSGWRFHPVTITEEAS